MDYFVLKQLGNISIPKPETKKQHSVSPHTPKTALPNPEEPSVRVMENLSALDKFDYLAAEAMVSSRVKLLLEQYLIEDIWRPCAFINPNKQDQRIFWFLPPLPYTPDQIIMAPNGTLHSIKIKDEDFARKSPGMFRIPNPGKPPLIVVHLSIAESILRRGICGLDFSRLSC